MNIYKRYQVRSTYIQFDPDHKNTFFNKLSCLNSCLKPNADALRPTQYEANDEPIQERQVILLCFKLWKYLNNKTLV